MKARLLFACALSAATALGCGPQFEPGNEINTLRVLAVKKDKPYAKPGEDVRLQLLWHDPKGRTDIQRAFIGGCVNPPGDLYYGCFAQYAAEAAKGALPPLQGGRDDFLITLPSDIISERKAEPGQPRYGVYIVFFAVCAGAISFDMAAGTTNGGSEGLPIRCLDTKGNGQPLGSEDFVVGYSTIYSFERATNQNPSFASSAKGKTEFEVAGRLLAADCVGEACQGAPPLEVDCDAVPERCVAACDDDGDSACPAIDVKPAIETSVVENDEVSSERFGTAITEQIWINYYVDRGGISEVRLVNDSNSGFNSKYRGELRAPQKPGPLQVWAVLHDNRGGIDFSRITLGVK